MIKLSGFYTIDSSNTPFLCNELISIIGPMPYKFLIHIADFAITQQDYTVAFVCVGRKQYKEIYRDFLLHFVGISKERFYSKRLSIGEIELLKKSAEKLKTLPLIFEVIDSYDELLDKTFDSDYVLIDFDDNLPMDFTRVMKALLGKTHKASSGCTCVVAIERINFINEDYSVIIPPFSRDRSFKSTYLGPYPNTIEELYKSNLNLCLTEEKNNLLVELVDSIDGYLYETMPSNQPDDDNN